MYYDFPVGLPRLSFAAKTTKLDYAKVDGAEIIYFTDEDLELIAKNLEEFIEKELKQ